MADINGTSSNDTIVGTPESDTINAGAGSDTVNALGGDDVVNGEDGIDTLHGDDGNDRLFGGLGQDFLHGGLGNDYLDGGRGGGDLAFGNRLYGNDGDDTLIGGGSNMYGGPGNDTYEVFEAGFFEGPFSTSEPRDQVFEVAGEGYDTVYLTSSEVRIFGPDQDIEAIIVAFTDREASIFGTDINNLLIGGPLNDHIGGHGGDDVIVGGLGADLMEGGAGSDTYYVDNAGDEIVDPVAEGTDRVAASVSYAIDSNADIEIIEAITLSATNALTFVGNQFAQTLIGNAGSNVLYGEGGNDTLLGLGGDDFLFGGPGNDVMDGGSGNDTYYVDAVGDLVIEEANGGIDRIAAASSVFLDGFSHVELLEALNLTSTNALDFTGSLIANTIIGNNGANVIRGGGGNDELVGAGGNDVLIGDAGVDVLHGGTGDDTYYVEDAGDLVFEDAGAGNDRVATNASIALPAGSYVEVLEAVNLHSTNALDLIGSDTANRLVGNDGVNFLDGRGGSDSLFGGGGADAFHFGSLIGNGEIDQIIDFYAGTDRISLDDAVFSTLSVGQLSNDAFRVGSAAQDADDRVVYDPATGGLFYDADGAGGAAAVQFAMLGTDLQLSASDFVVV